MRTRAMKLKERTVAGTFLHKLPAELLGIIATHTDNEGLKSMRATCRELRDGSASEFFRRHTSLETRLSGSEQLDIIYLVVETKTPDVVMAQAMTQSLILPQASNLLNVSPRNRKPLRGRIPKRLVSIYTDFPSKGDFEMMQRTMIEPSTQPGSAPLLLKRMALLVPQTLQLRKLVLEDLDVDGDDLINLLDAHQRNLQQLNLRQVVLTKAVECVAALSRTEAQEISLDEIGIHDEAGNLQYLVRRSPVLRELLRLLQQRDPDWIMYHYGKFVENKFDFRRSDEL